MAACRASTTCRCHVWAWGAPRPPPPPRRAVAQGPSCAAVRGARPSPVRAITACCVYSARYALRSSFDVQPAESSARERHRSAPRRHFARARSGCHDPCYASSSCSAPPLALALAARSAITCAITSSIFSSLTVTLSGGGGPSIMSSTASADSLIMFMALRAKARGVAIRRAERRLALPRALRCELTESPPPAAGIALRDGTLAFVRLLCVLEVVSSTSTSTTTELLMSSTGIAN